ncbi:MAG: Anaerobic nitric oxide reductase transcription regulator NorR [Planctomycetes bacterium]|nr:Anaerobic nitric oxide reductase transcription regulator NorR [Planctomycetota bacterium]
MRVPAVGAILDHVSRDERRLIEGASTLAAYPLTGPEGRGGALVVLFRSSGDGAGRPVGDGFLAALARATGLALEASRLYRLAVRDPETGAHVASWFRERLREEVDRAVASKRPISLLLVGATAAPPDPASSRAAAQRIAELVRSFAPGRAFLGRMEPLAFALAVPESDRAGAESLALEIRRAAAEPQAAALRLRVGVASCPEDAGSSEFLIAESRRALAVDAGASTQPAGSQGDASARTAAEARTQGFVFDSPEGRALLETIDRIAASGLTILVQGETGTGKEVVADLVHRRSPRAAGPFVKINCAALPEALLESELFGYERGAFTGADRTKPGRFEMADGGTIFLDEIGELPLQTQAKLLRVLEDRTVEHLGGTRGISVDVRIVAATNRDLASAVADGRFREDLYYRLNAVTLAIPPLRARKQDIPALAASFLRSASAAHGRRPPALDPDAMDLLFRHDWPGNVRELKNLMEQAAVLCQGETLRAADLAPALAAHGRARARPAAAPSPHAPVSSARPSSDPFPSPPRESSRPQSDDSPAAVSDRQRRLLALLSEREWITTGEYCEQVGVSPRTALRDVRELVERGVLAMEGKRRGARYRLR